MMAITNLTTVDQENKWDIQGEEGFQASNCMPSLIATLGYEDNHRETNYGRRQIHFLPDTSLPSWPG